MFCVLAGVLAVQCRAVLRMTAACQGVKLVPRTRLDARTNLVLTSIMTLSAAWMISGVVPTDAPAMIDPSDLMAVASTIATKGQISQ